MINIHPFGDLNAFDWKASGELINADHNEESALEYSNAARIIDFLGECAAAAYDANKINITYGYGMAQFSSCDKKLTTSICRPGLPPQAMDVYTSQLLKIIIAAAPRN